MKQGILISLPEIDQTYLENCLYNDGVVSIAGVDEVGRGCLAGPVLAASVILPKDCGIEGINDSKKLSPKKRDELFDKIIYGAISYGVGIVSSEEIDKINILQATLKAMKIAVECLKVKPQFLLVDGNQPLDTQIQQKLVVKGDVRSISVGAASIVAKVTRDRMMAEYDKKFPGYDFAIHKGYGTADHLAVLQKLGATAIHRKTFAGVR